MCRNLPKNARKKLGVSQKEVAKKIKKSQSFVSKVENCQIVSIDPGTLLNLSTSLSIDLVELCKFFDSVKKLKEEEKALAHLEKIEYLRKELEKLYLKEGLTDRVLELSQKLDKELCKVQKKNLQF